MGEKKAGDVPYNALTKEKCFGATTLRENSKDGESPQ